jgi:peptide/nickel transport system permease protein
MSDGARVGVDETAAGLSARARPLRSVERALGLGLFLALCGVALLTDRLFPDDPFAAVGAPLRSPSLAHLFGTDDLGRDLLAAVVHGLRTSLGIALGVVAIAGPLGIGVGTLAGYRGGPTDDVLMRAAEFVQVVPRFFLAVLVMALVGPGLDRLVLLLGLTAWPGIARVVRAETLSLKARPFIEASRALGASSSRTLLRELLPNALPPALVVLSLAAAGAILTEAGLSFLGLGDPAVVSLGYLAKNAQQFLRVAWWLAVFPGAAIAFSILALALCGDVLGDALRPQGR